MRPTNLTTQTYCFSVVALLCCGKNPAETGSRADLSIPGGKICNPEELGVAALEVRVLSEESLLRLPGLGAAQTRLQLRLRPATKHITKQFSQVLSLYFLCIIS